VSPREDYEFPPEQKEICDRARRLEWWSLVYTGSAAALMYVTMGTSQAMRTNFFDDVISMVPAIAFLVAMKIAVRPASLRFCYGYHTAVSIGYLTASLALLAMGSFLLIEAAIKLMAGERTTIGGMTLFGQTFWAGWPMLLALIYGSVPSFFLGRAKLRLAPQIHDKILFADAEMMKADWMAAAATAIGVMGVGLGYWWADPVAAALVSLDILHDGATNVANAVTDLMKERPKKTDGSGLEPLPEELEKRLRELDWVEAAEVRLREDGHVFFGEAYVVPRGGRAGVGQISRAVDHAMPLNWRLHDLTITLVDRLPREGS
jgi:divalent metal cation (Fe/Co/Zn/Cd) transporter